MTKAEKIVQKAKIHQFTKAYLWARGVTPNKEGLYTLGDKKYKLIGGELIEQL